MKVKNFFADKRRIKKVGIHLAVFAVTLALLWSGLVLSALIPNESIRANFEKSAEYYMQNELYPRGKGRLSCSEADNYADGILLNIAWNMGNGSPLKETLDTDYHFYPLDQTKGLYRTVVEGKQPDKDYTRYWHGGAMPVRVLHLFTDVNGIKLIGLVTALAGAAWTVGMLLRRRQFGIAVMFAVSLAAVHVWNIRLSLEYQTPFIIGLLLCPFCLWLERKGDGFLSILGVIGGTTVAFFDFLTTETVTVLLPLILVVALRYKEGRLGQVRNAAKLIVKCLLCWGLAYAGVFIVKWVVTSLVLGENVISLAVHSAAVRIGGELDNAKRRGILAPIYANLTALFYGVEKVELARAFIGLAVIVAVSWFLFFFFGKKLRNSPVPLLAMLGGTVLLRYMVLYNHSVIHAFFTYRALVSPLLALLLVFLFKLDFRKRRRSGK
ncbi:MAG: hypothetical protein IKM04_04985 [Clostridia bacterium]|nr:hypothetical protein [Clostridia bacterium]